jgi:uncharacterized protein YndB with AHSA1/START domain
MGTLKIETRGDREIVMTRVFDAARKHVFDALTKPELLKRWLYGPEGWTLAVCEIDLRVGGAYRYLWRGPGGIEIPSCPSHAATVMGMRGVFKEVVPPDRLVATGKFDEAWYPGEEVSTWVLVEKAGKTTLTQTVRYDSREARDIVMKSPMEEGVTVGYDRLAELVKGKR